MELAKMEVYPFVRLNYNGPEHELPWAKKIELVSKTIGEVEVLMVERGYRDASTCHMNKNDINEKIRELNSRGMLFTPIQWVKKYQGFSHNHVYTDENDPSAICYGVITRNKKAGETFRDANIGQRSDHEVLGQLLGYPSCCRKFFSKLWDNGYIDTIWHQALNTGYKAKTGKNGNHSISLKGYPECVALQRYWGVRVSFHLPCSFTCEETKKLAAVYFDQINSIDKNAASALMEILSLPAYWDAHRGVAVVTTPHYTGMTSSVPCAKIHTVYYEPVHS